MDPNVLLQRIGDYLRHPQALGEGTEDGEALDWACQNLFDWLDRGGFAPDWGAEKLATSYYDCRAVSHRRGERLQ